MMRMFYYDFPRYFSPFSFFFFSFFFSLLLYPHFSHVYVQDRPIHQTIILHAIEFFTKEYCLEIECRPIFRPRSVMNPGSSSIHTLPLAHFHLGIHLNTLLVVVSTKKERKRNKYREALYVRQLMIVEVIRCSHIGEFKTITIISSSSSTTSFAFCSSISSFISFP